MVKLAVSKIKNELAENKNESLPVEPIAKYLIDKCEKDGSFAARVVLENKNLKECFVYVYSEVRKKLTGSGGYLPDSVVYKMAEDYFILDKVEINKKIQIQKKPKEEPKKEIEVKKLKKAPIKEKVLTLDNAEQFTLFDA